MASSSFKVIIAGGGPVGLTAAHALSRAGIDFTLLESRDNIVIQAGYNVVLSPLSMRAFGQLDLLDQLNKVSAQLKTVMRLDHTGRDLGNMNWFQYVHQMCGVYPQVLSRHDLTKVLYSNLPADAQAKIEINKKITDIESTSNGVTVSCADGTSYTASLIIGADGAHSMIRTNMRKLALAAGCKDDEINPEEPFLTTYRCLWIRFPTSACAELVPGTTSETHGNGAAVQLFVGERTGTAGLYERLDAPRRHRVRYTKEDEEEAVKKWGSLPIVKGNKEFTLAKLYETREESGLLSLEEGVVEHWSWGGRVVLVGDAAHKFTPNTGAGCNHGVADVVALANQLNKMIKAADSAPSEEQVAEVLRAYRDERITPVQIACAGAGKATGLSTWADYVSWFMDFWVVGSFLQRFLFNTKTVATSVSKAPVFDYFPGTDKFSGAVPWLVPMPKPNPVATASA
ncbi:hypothetical protein B0I35DRAFT_350162 [Stachybotrys elegans]|uniref:FAD-binding domain-containing protein n=1 Tax=Stachybotrys elegans TaxID=80388 RepID=A0A8K0WSL9_9HYPO|nr:hypothetical protein B0I35DRAFT_350162 [Stachybotrys elegans]